MLLNVKSHSKVPSWIEMVTLPFKCGAFSCENIFIENESTIRHVKILKFILIIFEIVSIEQHRNDEKIK